MLLQQLMSRQCIADVHSSMIAQRHHKGGMRSWVPEEEKAVVVDCDILYRF